MTMPEPRTGSGAAADTSSVEPPPFEKSPEAAEPVDGKDDSNIVEWSRRWKPIVLEVKDEYTRDNVPLLGAGVAFYALLAVVPALVAIVSIYGMVASPEQVQRQITNSLSAAPAEVQNLLQRQLTHIVETEGSGLGIGAFIGIALALWAASKGMKHLISAINAAYNQEETRGYVKLRVTALLMTAGAIVGLIVAFGAIAILPVTGSQGTALVCGWCGFGLCRRRLPGGIRAVLGLHRQLRFVR